MHSAIRVMAFWSSSPLAGDLFDSDEVKYRVDGRQEVRGYSYLHATHLMKHRTRGTRAEALRKFGEEKKINLQIAILHSPSVAPLQYWHLM